MPDKAKQAKAMVKSISKPVKSISKQLTKIASSTSNSDDSKLEKKSSSGMVRVGSATMIDDVPLNKKVVKRSSGGTRPTRTKISPAPTTVIGNQELKLKVSHNDAGRVVISLSDPDRVLVQVHVDESVLKSKGGVLKKKTKMSSSSRNLRDDKDRPKKKSSTVTTKKPKKKPSSADTKKRKKNEHRDLPDEATSGREKSKSKHGAARNFTAQFSSMMSVVSGLSGQSHDSCGSDDSTRSPKDLNRDAANAPKTPRAQKGFAPEGHTPSTEPDLIEENVPIFDRRRQKMIRRQNSKIMNEAPGSGGSPPQLHDQMDTGTEAKVEEGEFPAFSSPVHQRRLQQRQRRLERQQSAEKGGETFRSTRSIRSGKRPGRSLSPTRRSHNVSNVEVPAGPLDPPSMHDLDDATPASFPTLMDASSNTRNSKNSYNRATHMRHLPPEDDDDDSMTSNSKRGRKKRSSKVRKPDTSCPAVFSKQSSYKKIQRRGLKVDEMDEEGLLKHGAAASVSASTSSINTGVSSSNRTGCNLLSMICDKVCNKRPKKEHP